MAKNDAAETTETTDVLIDIDELKETKQTPLAIFSGACVLNNWAPGKMITPEIYDKGIEKFLNYSTGSKEAN